MAWRVSAAAFSAGDCGRAAVWPARGGSAAAPTMTGWVETSSERATMSPITQVTLSGAPPRRARSISRFVVSRGSSPILTTSPIVSEAT